MHIKAEVVIKDGAEAGGKYLLDPGEYVVGRDESCDIVLQGAGISFRHAQFIITPSRLMVVDLNSTNGIFVGEHRVDGAERILPGDRIFLGAKCSAEIWLIEDQTESPVVDERVGGGTGEAKKEDAVLESPAEAVGLKNQGCEIGKAEEESALAHAEALRQIEKLRDDHAEQSRLLERERRSAAKAREKLLRKIEQIEQEKQTQAAAASEEWTRILNERESALEELAEERATREYQQRLAARKIDGMRAEQAKHLQMLEEVREEGKKTAEELLRRVDQAEQKQRNQEGAMQEREDALSILSGEKDRLAALEQKHLAAFAEGEAHLAASSQNVERLRAEIARLREELEGVRKERTSAVEKLGRLRETVSARLKSASAELEAALNRRAFPPHQLIESGKYDNCRPPEPSKVGQPRNLGAKARESSPTTTANLMTTDASALLGTTDDRGPSEAPGTDPPTRRGSGVKPPGDGFRLTVFQKRCLFWGGILCVGLLLAVSTVGGYGAYKNHQVKKLTGMATDALARSDYEEASLNVRRALQLDETYLPACKLMAEIGEKAGDSRAVTWRQRVVELSPGSVDERIAFASTALRFGKRKVAMDALRLVGESDRNRADFHAVSAAAALAEGNKVEAERGYAEAVRLAPENPIYRVELGIVQSGSKDYFSRQAGQRLLAELGEHPEVGTRALRGLVASYESTGEFSTALRVSRRLVNAGDHTFADELLCLKFLRRTSHPEFADSLVKLQAKAVAKPASAASLVAWMNAEGLASQAIEWATQTAPEVAKMPALAPVLAGSFTVTRNWSALLKLTQGEPWQGTEYVRHAYRARALRESGQIPIANSAWKSAITSASSEPDALAWLARIAADWDWPDENEAALLALVGGSESRKPLNILAGRYLAAGNTAGLRRLAARLMEGNPADDNAKNDYAILSLLLHTDVERALRIAQELHSRHPNHSGYASTYAFALNYTGRAEEALRIIQKLPTDQLDHPEFAAYYGIILVATGAPEKAIHYLQVACKAPLLKEELELVERTLQEAKEKPAKQK